MASSSAEALVIEGLSKRFGTGRAGVLALDRVDLRIEHGQLFGLIGHNGAGKSTLFKLILGLAAPTAGRVAVDGVSVGGRDFRRARRSIGYLPENLVLYDNLSGLETLQFFARLKDAPLSQCEALLERVGLAGVARRAVREYSKGMRQRLGFAQALLGRPRLLLLDEPTTGLDPGAIRDFYQQLDLLRAQGVTIVISSHILAELQQRVDRLAILGNGSLRAQGSVAELRERADMPVLVTASGDASALQRARAALADGPAGVVWDVQAAPAGELHIRCPRARKMGVLQALGGVGLHDLVVREPSLEDVYFGLKEGA